MKTLLPTLILILTSYGTKACEPQAVELTGRLLGSFVSTSSGLTKGTILHISDVDSLEKVYSLADGNPKKVLLKHENPALMSKFAGKMVTVSGTLHARHTDMFHTDYVLNVIKIDKP